MRPYHVSREGSSGGVELTCSAEEDLGLRFRLGWPRRLWLRFLDAQRGALTPYLPPYLYFSRALRTNSLVYESAGFRSFASLTAGSKPISTLCCASTPEGGNRPSFE